MSITKRGDSEGYVTFECPFCGSEFKLHAGEYQDKDMPFQDLFCPYCGLTDEKNSFLSHDVIEQMQNLNYNYMVEELNKAFGEMAKSLDRKNSISKMKFKPLEKVTVRELAEKDTTEVVFECEQCNRHVKVLHCTGAAKKFCPYCGVDI